ncbi:hypothetical protein EJ06DRAFT_559394 [Trichodelitschia bisporula]|uniref:Uncharacterized protein n=1 Tax=Trichodelitschia bisporula TaxID=703511 RepID=A0A6G1HN65_9PEZI|nr:hypothetical protein EJ06DRAFT_559394 [Trichodelitschia bisporula]
MTFGSGSDPNVWTKPQTVVFKFLQKQFDRTGEVQDDRGRVLYKLNDIGEKHTFGFIKTYPLEIVRVSDGRIVGIIHWKDSPTKAKVEKLPGREDEVRISEGLFDELYVQPIFPSATDTAKLVLEDGRWRQVRVGRGIRRHLGECLDSAEMDPGLREQKVFDHRLASPCSLTPGCVAMQTPRKGKTGATTLEVVTEVLNSTPDLLEYLIVGSIWLEFSASMAKSEAASSPVPEVIIIATT